jgi:hypothetical protein
MTLNSSGPISLGGATAGQSVNLELGFSATATITMNTTAVRTLAGFPTAGTQYSMSNFYGKSNRQTLSYTFTSNTANAALNVNSIGGYASGTSDITVTVNAGIYLYATTTADYGLNLTGGASGDTITVVNNGYIIGCGGAANGQGTDGSAGGPALNVGAGINITVNNTNASAYIAGGGGGAGAFNGGGGGGAGGGTGGNGGGAGGGVGSSGANGAINYACCCSGPYLVAGGGGGGGRILPGSGGGYSTANRNGLGGGAGGGGGTDGSGTRGGANGGSSNATGPGSCRGGAGGGGWGAAGGLMNVCGCAFFYGGAGGKAVNLNGKTVTWTSGNTTRVWGAVS